jgi:hypothetical protein
MFLENNLIVEVELYISTYSIPEIIFSYSSHQGTWSSFFAFSISSVFFAVAAILTVRIESFPKCWPMVLVVIYTEGRTACHWRGSDATWLVGFALSYQDRRLVELLRTRILVLSWERTIL